MKTIFFKRSYFNLIYQLYKILMKAAEFCNFEIIFNQLIFQYLMYLL